MTKQFKGPKYNSDFITILNRKVLFKDPIIIEDLIFDNNKSHSKTNINNRDGGLDVSGITNVSDITDIIDNNTNKIRLLNLIFQQIQVNLACCLSRKLLLTKNLPDSIKYMDTLSKRFGDTIKPHQCLQDENLVIDVEHLLPSEFEPNNILLVSYHDSIQLQERFPDASIKFILPENLKEVSNEQYDFVILSNVLHHDKTIANRIISNIKTDGYLFVRDLDVDEINSSDTDVLNIIHMIIGKSTNKNFSYIQKKSISELFQDINYHSENQTRIDNFSNPARQYYVLFKK